MRYFILFLTLLQVSVLMAQNADHQSFYVGTYTRSGSEGIYLCSLNLKTGELEVHKAFGGIENPSFIKLSPGNKFLYSVSEAGEKGSFVYAFRVESNKDLTLLNKQTSNGKAPCHIGVSVDGKFVATATYVAGTTSLYPVGKDGTLKEASSVNINKGSSVNESRQTKPHAHSIKFSPYGNQVFSADLGTDNLDIYEMKNGKLEKGTQTEVKMTPGAGPRHFEFHPNKEVIYVINELNSTVSTVKKENGQWTVVQDIATLPDYFKEKSNCADIHISSDGKYLYGSNRGHNSIVVFEVSKKNQLLKMRGTVSVEGDWPRNFGITPNGKWMLVANQKSNDITVFKINKGTGMPEYTGHKLEIPSPVCVEFFSPN